MHRLIFPLLSLVLVSACSATKPVSQNPYTVVGDAPFPALLQIAGANEQLSDVHTEAQSQPRDIWNRIREGFVLADAEHPRLDRELNWFVRHPDYMQRVAERAKPYMHYIVDTIEAHDIPSELALLPIVESAFQPFAYSHGRASGIWQFIPSTGRRFGLKQNWWYDGRRDIYASTIAAVNLLDTLQKQFNGDWMLALAAYNSGSGTVRKAIRRNKRRGKPTDFWSLKLPRETRAYVPKLLALKKLIDHPEKYNLELPAIDDIPYFTRVDVGSQIDLAKAAELAELELDELYRLNPGYNRWATAPNGPNYLLLPVDKSDIFKQQLAELPVEQRIRWVRHRIRKGETLSSIARKYNTSSRTIKRLNRIRGHRLRAGRGLTIPVASKKLNSYSLSANQRKSQLQNKPRKGTRISYIVKAGDTFWDLARRHKINVRQLAKWNSMAPRDPLTPGQRLVIWSRKAKSVSVNDFDNLRIPEQRKITKRIGYRVRRGDSLSRISRKFRVSINQLKRWNRRLSRNKYLQPGQRLTLYIDVTRTSG